MEVLFLSLSKRFKYHKNNNNNLCNSKLLFNIFGISNLEIVLIKEYLIQKEKINYCLLMYETLYMNKCRIHKINIINKQTSFGIQFISKKYYENNKEYFYNYNKKYYIDNKNNFYCNLCNIYFVCESYLNEHKNTKNHKLKNNEKLDKHLYKYQCKYCEVYINNKELFVKHIKSIDHINILKNNNLNNNDSIYKFKYECKSCNF